MQTKKHNSTQYISRSQNRGFTLIELMIASSIFVVIIVAGMSVLINTSNGYRQTTEVRQSLDTMSFIMEDITRNIRLGTSFNCGNTAPSSATIETPSLCAIQSSPLGRMGSSWLALEAYNGLPGNSNDQVVYFLLNGKLYKKSQFATMPTNWTIPPNSPYTQISPNDVVFDMIKSGFSVSQGLITQGKFSISPLVTVHLVGYVAYHSTQIPFNFEASIAPRDLPSM